MNEINEILVKEKIAITTIYPSTHAICVNGEKVVFRNNYQSAKKAQEKLNKHFNDVKIIKI